MTTPQAALIERLQALTEPDRECDLELWWWCKASHSWLCPMDSDYKAHNLKMDDAPRYTASLDAALTLVPDGMDEEIKRARHRKGWRVNLWLPEHVGYSADATSLAITICIAALKARTSSQPTPREG